MIGLHAPRHDARAGFSVIELLVAMTITMLLAGALAGIAQPARQAFDRVPAELELQQRGRTAIDALSQLLRVALFVVEEPGTYTELTLVVRVAGAGQGTLSVDQADPASMLMLDAVQCPNIKDVCGFVAGATALLTDAEGNREVFAIASTNVDARSIAPEQPLSRAYTSGARIVEVQQYTLRLDEQADGSYSLIRETAAGAIQPIADFLGELGFDVTATQVDVRIIAEPPVESRASIPSRPFRTSILMRNAS